MTFKDFGVRRDNFKNSLIPYFCLTTLLGSLLLIYARVVPNQRELLDVYYKLYPFYFVLIILSFLQEFFFRGILMFYLSKFSNSPLKVILINALLFTLLHAIFPYKEIILPGAFIAGLSFATVYYYYPNLILISLSHIIVNTLIIPYCYLKLLNC